jgi:hypothetical protein
MEMSVDNFGKTYSHITGQYSAAVYFWYGSWSFIVDPSYDMC